jgi:AAHS family 4-hydroxybenzoate transporter-like MFS transporter
MQAESSTIVAVLAARLHLRSAWLCGVVLFLEGYDIADVGYAIPSLVDAWKIQPSVFSQVLTAGNVGLMLGSVCAGLLGDRLGRKPVLISCVVAFGLFSLLSAFVGSPSQLEGLRFLTGLGLGGGLPLSLALASDFVRPGSPGRLVILMSVGVPIGFSVGGLLAGWLVGIFGWPAIFVTGGVLPLAVVPLLVLWLPESIAARLEPRRHNVAAALFQHGLAPSTFLLWAINVFSLLGTFFILLWTPAILHSTGASPSQAILATTIYALGVIASPLLAALIVDRIAIERVLACGLAFGALCVLAIGLFYPRFWLLSLFLCGAGLGGGSQAGINSLSALAYPPAIRSTGAGWALGAGRVGAIGGALLGGALLALGFRVQKIFVAASIPAFLAALMMAILGRLRSTGQPGRVWTSR